MTTPMTTPMMPSTDPAVLPETTPDYVLLTPGPLTTAPQTRAAATVDWGSWDGDFRAVTREVCDRLLAIADRGPGYACVPMQGSGTFIVEAMVGTLVPRDGKLLVLSNGAYGDRMVATARRMGRAVDVLRTDEDVPPDPQAVADRLRDDAAITHVAVVQCETTTGILNPVDAVAQVVQAAGRRLLVDAMSAFGALPLAAATRYDAIVASSNKCLEGLPGFGFAVVREDALRVCEGNAHSLSLDLYDQWLYLQRTGQWRFTPPTHVVAAFLQALRLFEAEGGRPAREARYRANCAALVDGLRRLGLQPLLAAEIQAPIIVTVHAPVGPGYDFSALYAGLKARGFVIYPGKLTRAETFRVGCIGAIGPEALERFVDALADVLQQQGLAPRHDPSAA